MLRIDQALRLVQHFVKEAESGEDLKLRHFRAMAKRDILDRAFQEYTENPNGSSKYVIIEVGDRKLRASFDLPRRSKPKVKDNLLFAQAKPSPTKRANSKYRVEIRFPFEQE